jgi:hypothetical protein
MGALSPRNIRGHATQYRRNGRPLGTAPSRAEAGGEGRMVTEMQFRRICFVVFAMGLATAPLLNTLLP